MKNKGLKIANFFLKWVSMAAAFVFVIQQSGNDTCLIWQHQPEIPKAPEDFSINDL